ncbi:hypothetical protein [Bartonella sp. ML70XJBT]|uniref:hypothetical protein n=1 Tax=Bartonella sp. ML70XJBT TaxID=3019096 RepID=UPI00235E10D9|nr:hypothetical protein [Bartonella sp. ML70XJBT]
MGSSSGSHDYCSADNFSNKYNSGSAFGSQYGGKVGFLGGFALGGWFTHNSGYAMSAASFGGGLGSYFGDTIGGYVGYGVAAAQCGIQSFGRSIAHSGVGC